MASPCSVRSDDSIYEEVAEYGLALLSDTQIEGLCSSVDAKCAAALDCLLSLRDSGDKMRLLEKSILDITAAFKDIVTNYAKIRTTLTQTKSMKRIIAQSVREEISKFASNLHQTDDSALKPVSYAAAVTKGFKPEAFKVRVPRGPTVVVPKTTCVTIGPKAASSKKFASSSATCAAVMKAFNPADAKLKITKIVEARNCSIKIIAESGDIDKLKNLPALDEVGLEVKLKDKLNPRILVRNVPVTLSSEEIAKEIRDNNFENKSVSPDFKLVYKFPAKKDSTVTNWVLETSSEVRNMLLLQGRVFLTWQSCKVEDYLRVLQCYKCLLFGHVAKSCPNSVICGKCADHHETRTCSKDKSLHKCQNCMYCVLSAAHVLRAA